MTRVLLDTTCLVAVACGWHADHDATVADIALRTRRGETLLLAAHSLAEAFAVLTRLPGSRRLGSMEALTLLRGSWADTVTIDLTGREYWTVLEGLAEAGVGGGLVYDALIAACARKGRASVLLTWNTADFSRLAGSFEVRTPAARTPKTR